MFGTLNADQQREMSIVFTKADEARRHQAELAGQQK
jgi:hypothetical protein